MPFEMHKKEFAPRKLKSRAHTPISRAHAPLARRTDALISPGGNSCPGLNRTRGRESIPSISTLFRGGFEGILPFFCSTERIWDYPETALKVAQRACRPQLSPSENDCGRAQPYYILVIVDSTDKMYLKRVTVRKP